MGSGTRTSMRPWLLLAACIVATAGCGARWSDSERADVFARRSTAASSQTGTGGQALAGAVLDAGPNVGAGPSDAGSTGAASSGTTGGPATAVDGGARPCAAPSDAPGLSDRQITVANLATVTGPVPGLGAPALAATRAYVAHRNATGGVCGRSIHLLTADDGNDGSRSRVAMADFAKRAVAVIGLFAPSSGGAADIIESAQLPVLGTAGDPAIRAVSTVFNLNPPPPNLTDTIEKFRYLRSQGVTTAAVVTLSAAAAVLELDQHQAQIEAAGIKVVSRQLLPVTTLSFDSAARAVANSRADYLFFLGAAQHDASMARSMRGSGYTLKFEEYATGYGSSYAEMAGSAAEGTTSWIRSLPAEEAGRNAELDTFLDAMERYSPGSSPDVFAADAWAASKAFFDSLEQLPGPISREAILRQLRTLTDYDADGMIGPIDLANSISNGCLIGVRFEAGSWHRFAPAQGFMC